MNLIDKAQVFTSSSFGNLTVFIQGGQPWFVAKEVADALGYSKTNAMTKRLRDKDKDNIPEFLIQHEVKKLAQTIPSSAEGMIPEVRLKSNSSLDQNEKLAQTMGSVAEPMVSEGTGLSGSMRDITVITES